MFIINKDSIKFNDLEGELIGKKDLHSLEDEVKK